MKQTTRLRAQIVLVAVSYACSDPPPRDPIPADVDTPIGSPACGIDPSLSPETAYDAVLATPPAQIQLTESICPAGDIDYWRFPVAQENGVVDITLVLDSIASANLAAHWLGPRGVCAPEPAPPCDPMTGCDAGTVCDPFGDICRVDPERACFSSDDCLTGQSCAINTAPIASVYQPQTSGVLNRLMTRFAASMPGHYIIGIEDNNRQIRDATYTLEVGQHTDPDTHEPNGEPHLATPLDSGVTAEGFFAFASDVDWYVLDPSAVLTATHQPVVTVEVRWPKETSAEPDWLLWQDGELVAWPSEVDWSSATDNVARRTRVTPNDSPLLLQVQNPSGTIDERSGYQVTLTVAEDLTEPTRNDTAITASAIDATGPGPLFAQGGHTLCAENDADWYRIDRPVGALDNALLYFRAACERDAEILLKAVFYRQQGGDLCDATFSLDRDGEACADGACTCDIPGALCFCGNADGCMPGEGTCLAAWSKLPMHRDPAGDAQLGGRSPNHLETQLPLFDSGVGSLYIEIKHIRETPLPLQGHSATDAYSLEIALLDEPDAIDRYAPASHYESLPFVATAADLFARRNPMGLTGVLNGDRATRGFVSLAPAQQAVVDPTVDSCVPLNLDAITPAGTPAASDVNTTVSITLADDANAILLANCAGTPLAQPLTITGPSHTIGLRILANPIGTLPYDIEIQFAGVLVETTDAHVTVTDTLLPQLSFAAPPNPWTPGTPPRLFFVTEPSPPLRIILPQSVDDPGYDADVVVGLSVSSSDAQLCSADFGPSAQYCVCDIDCLDVCNCAELPCEQCACRPDPLCSPARRCNCTDEPDGVCPGMPAPFDNITNPCTGVLYGDLAQQSCEKVILAGVGGTSIHVARQTPGAVSVHATADGFASTSWVLLAETPMTFAQIPPGLGASGYISYAGDQDWFELNLPAHFPASSARIEVTYPPSPVDIRFGVMRVRVDEDGTPTHLPADLWFAAGLGRVLDRCNLDNYPICDDGATCNTARNTCAQDIAFGTASEPASVDPNKECTFIPLADDEERTTEKLYVWINDVDFNDWDESAAYHLRVELVEGCSTQCSPFICSQ